MSRPDTALVFVAPPKASVKRLSSIVSEVQTTIAFQLHLQVVASLFCGMGPKVPAERLRQSLYTVRLIRRRAVGRREFRTPKLRTEGQAPSVLKCLTALPHRGQYDFSPNSDLARQAYCKLRLKARVRVCQLRFNRAHGGRWLLRRLLSALHQPSGRPFQFATAHALAVFALDWLAIAKSGMDSPFANCAA